MTRKPEQIPCTQHEWCQGHLPSIEQEPYTFHMTELAPATVGESSITLNAAQTEDGSFEFSFEIDWWTIEESDVDQEFADLRSILDQMEAQARRFIAEVRGIPTLPPVIPLFVQPPPSGDAA